MTAIVNRERKLLQNAWETASLKMCFINRLGMRHFGKQEGHYLSQGV